MTDATKGIVINRAFKAFWLSAGEGMTEDIAAAHIYEYGEVKRNFDGVLPLEFFPVEVARC